MMTTTIWRGSAWVAFLSLALPAAAQWPQPEGGGQIIICGGPYSARINCFDNRGNATRNGSIQRLDISPYWEHGLTQRWTVGIASRLQGTWMDQTATRSNGFSLAEASIFARYALYRGTSDVVSLQATLSTPGIGAIRNPYIAEPHASLEARITYGRSIPLPRDMSAFVALGAG